MSEQSAVVDTFESVTGVRHRDDETWSAYLDRLADELDLSAPDRERLAELANRSQFAADGLSDRDRRELAELAGRQDGEGQAADDAGGRTATSATGSPEAPVAGEGTNGEEPTLSIETGERSVTLPDAEPTTVDPARGRRERLSSAYRSTRLRLPELGAVPGLSTPDLVYLLPLVVAATFVFFYGLGAFPIQNWDEGFYANLARHMVQDGYWIVPHMYYGIGLGPTEFEPWLRLPPFGIWLQALSMLVFGVTEFAVRLPSAAASVLTVVVVYLLGRSLASRRTGFFAGVVYLTVPYVYAGFNGGRDGALDALLVLFGSLFVYTTWLAVDRDDRRWLYPMGLFAGLAVLTKGFGAGVFLLVVLPLVFLRSRTFVSKEMVVGSGITALLTVPWPAYMYSLYGDLFVREFFVRYVFDRAAGEAFGTNTNALFGFMDYPYIKELLFAPELFHPWSFVLLLVVPAFAYREIATDDDRSYLDTGLFVWWVLAAFGLFVFIGNKLWYLMPMFVPAAVLIGREVDAAMLGRGVDSAALAVGLIAVLAVSPDYSIVAQSGSVLTEGTVLAVGVVLVAWSGPLREALTSSLPPRLYRGFVRLAPALVTLVVLVAMIGVPPTTGGSGEQQAFAAELDRTAPASATVFVQRGLGTPFHTFSFYAQRPLESGTLAEFRESDTSYAIVESTAVSTVDAETTVLMRATVASGRSVSLIEVER